MQKRGESSSSWRNIKHRIMTKKGEKTHTGDGNDAAGKEAATRRATEKERDCERTAEAANSWTSNELNLRGESTAETNISASSLVSFGVPRRFCVRCFISLAGLSFSFLDHTKPAIVFLDSATREIREPRCWRQSGRRQNYRSLFSKTGRTCRIGTCRWSRFWTCVFVAHVIPFIKKLRPLYASLV